VTEPSPGVFGQFAAKWFPAMMSAVLGNAEEAAEEGIHCLLLDVCLTCLTWHTLFPAVHKPTQSLAPQVKVAADALMDYLVSVKCMDHCLMRRCYKWFAAVTHKQCSSFMWAHLFGAHSHFHLIKPVVFLWTYLPARSCGLCKDEGCCLCC
jgi:hypothetical protein